MHNGMLSDKKDPAPALNTAAVCIFQTKGHHIPLHYSPSDCSVTFHLCQLPTPAGQTTDTPDVNRPPIQFSALIPLL
jgi:hypothetical protein